jgi:hypothetical protein
MILELLIEKLGTKLLQGYADSFVQKCHFFSGVPTHVV